MKAIITLHPNAGASECEVIIVKGKRLTVDQAENNTLVVADNGHLRGVYPNVKSIQLTGKRKVAQEKDGEPSPTESLLRGLLQQLSPASLATSVAEGISMAERLADEKSQTRWACESNPVATAHPDFDAFIKSKMTYNDCAAFGLQVAWAERDNNLERALQAEQALSELKDQIAADMERQTNKQLAGSYATKLRKLGELISTQRQSANYNEYMRGMLNGMLLSESVFTGKDPVYMPEPPAVPTATTPAKPEPQPGHCELPAMPESPPGWGEKYIETLDNTPPVDKRELKKK